MSDGAGQFARTVSQGAGGVVSDITGQSAVANATGAAANAQLGQEQADRSTLMGLMGPSQQDIQQLSQAVSTNQQSIQQSQQLINAADPALISAAHNANQLLNGGSSALLAPIQNQRSQARAQLTQQLQQQLGPGYATSSAGIQALQNFDQQTSNLMTNAQQTTLSQLLGTTQNTASLGANQQQTGISNSTALAKGNQILYGGEANAIENSPVNPGLGLTGQLATAKANAAGLQSLFGFGSTNSSSLKGLLGGGSATASDAAPAADGVASAGGAGLGGTMVMM